MTGADSYELWRWHNGAWTQLDNSDDPRGLSYTDTNVAFGQRYYYTVAAVVAGLRGDLVRHRAGRLDAGCADADRDCTALRQRRRKLERSSDGRRQLRTLALAQRRTGHSSTMPTTRAASPYNRYECRFRAALLVHGRPQWLRASAAIGPTSCRSP